MTKSQDKQVTRCLCSAQTSEGDGEHSRWKQTEIWPCSNLEEWGFPTLHTPYHKVNRKTNSWFKMLTPKSLSVRSWVRLFILGTAITEPNEWIKRIHSTAENLDSKPGWCPCSWILSKLTVLCLVHAGNMLEQFDTLDHILDQLKKFQFKGTEHQIILFNI